MTTEQLDAAQRVCNSCGKTDARYLLRQLYYSRVCLGEKVEDLVAGDHQLCAAIHECLAEPPLVWENAGTFLSQLLAENRRMREALEKIDKLERDYRYQPELLRAHGIAQAALKET